MEKNNKYLSQVLQSVIQVKETINDPLLLEKDITLFFKKMREYFPNKHIFLSSIELCVRLGNLLPNVDYNEDVLDIYNLDKKNK